MNTQSVYLFNEMPIRKAIFKLALPTILALMVRAVYNIVDTAYLGFLNNTAVLSAIGVVTPLLLIINSFEVIFSIGGSLIISRQLGKKDKLGAEQTAATVTCISFLLGIFIAIIGIIFMEPVLKTFGASKAVLPYAKQYAFWMFLMTTFNIPTQSLNAIARGESEARIPSLAVMVGTVVNIVLDPILMFDWGFGLGITGAAIATAIAQLVSFLIIFGFFLSKNSYIHLHINKIHFTIPLLKEILITGIPSAITQLLIAFAGASCNIVAVSLPQGDYIIAACGVVQKIMIIGYNFVLGYVQGFQSIAAYAWGAHNYMRVIESIKATIKNLIKLTLSISCLYVVFSSLWLRIFTSSSEVIYYGKSILFSNSIFFIAFSISYLMTVLCQLSNEGKKGIALSIFRQGVFFIPLIFILTNQLGFNGFLLAQPVADLVTLIICAIALIKFNKKISAMSLA